MSDSSPDPSTLYDPPSESTGSASSDDDYVSLRLSMPKERAERLRAVAQQIGLSPTTMAKRAIEMVCDEVVTIQDDTRSPSMLVEQYQARIDLLHSVKQTKAETSDESVSTPTDPDAADVEPPPSEDPSTNDE